MRGEGVNFIVFSLFKACKGWRNPCLTCFEACRGQGMRENATERPGKRTGNGFFVLSQCGHALLHLIARTLMSCPAESRKLSTNHQKRKQVSPTLARSPWNTCKTCGMALLTACRSIVAVSSNNSIIILLPYPCTISVHVLAEYSSASSLNPSCSLPITSSLALYSASRWSFIT